MPLVLLSIPAAIGSTRSRRSSTTASGPPVLELGHPGPALPGLGLLLGTGRAADPDAAAARFTRFEIQDSAIWKIAELMAYAMFVNLFLLGAEVFKEYYSDTEHLIHMQYMFTGIGENIPLRSCPTCGSPSSARSWRSCCS